MSQFPKTIEVGGGPNIEVNSQAEADAFFASARANSQIMLRERIEAEAWPYVVHIVNSDLERPTAPLATCGPFPDRDAAVAFADEWSTRLAAPSVKAIPSRLPSAEYVAEWLVESGGFTLAEDEPA